MSLAEIANRMSRFKGRWWISGGHALELHLDRSWREHEDVDVGILRHDAPLLRDAFPDLHIYLAAAGTLTPWDGLAPSEARSENNLWCRRSDGTWVIDFPMNADDEESWIYRRDPSLRVPWNRAILRSSASISYLAPELQLLFKSKNLREKDDVDAREVIPSLDARGVATLRTHLPREHPWRASLDARTSG